MPDQKVERYLHRHMGVDFDLPEANSISEYYLRHCFQDATFFTAKDLKAEGKIGNADFVILPGWHMTELSTESIDLVVNTRSMMEMNASVVDYYMEEINRVTRTGGYCFCVNRYKKYKSAWGKRPAFYLNPNLVPELFLADFFMLSLSSM